MLVFLALFFGLVRYLQETDHRITSGRVYEVRRTGRAYITRVDYIFEVNGKTYNGNGIYSENTLPLANTGILLGKTFPVIYYTGMPALANSILLLPDDDCQQYGISYPDSLKWVLPLMEKP